MYRKTELLAPAGSFEILKAVIHAGADAVYAAGNRFGARAYAANFTTEEMLAAIDYVHLKGKKLYLTVNTLLKEREIHELYDFLCPFYEAGLDAVIVQDMGVLHFIRNHFPDLPIHASTQMTVTGAYGAKLLLANGCRRIVTARELSLAEISHIYQMTGAEIESFVHGALCYSYSGQCLLSSMIGGRSGNRGRCAQPCRLPYEFCETPGKSMTRRQQENYPLSLKDLCAIFLIPELIESGVHSLKIEGRMKQAEYAAGVTGIYRKYLDLYEDNPRQRYQVSDEDYQKLLDLGNRCGFTDGYYKKHNGRDMVTFHKPSHEKNQGHGQFIIPKNAAHREKEKIKGILRLSINNPASLVLEYKGIQAEVTGSIVQNAQKQPLARQTVLEKMAKTGNTPFQFGQLEVELEENSFLTVGALNELRRAGIDRLTELILQKYRRQLPDNPLAAQNGQKASGNIPSCNQQNQDVTMQRRQPCEQPLETTLPLSVLTETLEQFAVSLKQPEAARIYLESSALSRNRLCRELANLTAKAHKAGKTCYLALPHIFRMETVKWYETNWQQISGAADGYLVRNLEELSFLQEMGVPPARIQGDYPLYVFSREAIRGWEELSLQQYTLPVELNARELRDLGSGGEMIIYGYQPVMFSAQCLLKNINGCSHKENIFYLKDRYGKLFSVKNYCEGCYNIIYNISPLALFHQLREIKMIQPGSVRLSFTVEDGNELEEVFRLYRQALAGNLDKNSYLDEFTNGHFKRGVE